MSQNIGTKLCRTTLIRERLLIFLICHSGFGEDRITADAVTKTNDSIRYVRVESSCIKSAPTGSRRYGVNRLFDSYWLSVNKSYWPSIPTAFVRVNSWFGRLIRLLIHRLKRRRICRWRSVCLCLWEPPLHQRRLALAHWDISKDKMTQYLQASQLRRNLYHKIGQ